MAKVKTQYLCGECGETYSKWQGKCASCGAFNSIHEFKEAKLSSKNQVLRAGVDLTKLELQASNRRGQVRFSAKIEELDRVLGGGFFPGSVVLFGGHPGIGKSTLSLQIFQKLQTTAFYFSGEESVDQVQSRLVRIGGKNVVAEERIFSTNSLEDIVTTLQTQQPQFAVIDSIQMVGVEGSSFGTMSQIRENAEVLIKLAKSVGTTLLIIGHVTKNDEIAGPKVLEHLVDAVLYLEGERNSEIRLLRSPKNRFGSTLEVGVFEMAGHGLQELKNPSEFFLQERAVEGYGSVVTCIRDGARNFLLEVQALTNKTNFGQPRRTAHGMELSKVHLLLAVISKYTPFGCDEYDAYFNIIGGLRVQDPSVDLAIVAAVLSSRLEKEIAADTVVLGEVGLGGEVRRVGQLEARLKEIEKLGFKRVITPRYREEFATTLHVVKCNNVADILKYLFSK